MLRQWAAATPGADSASIESALLALRAACAAAEGERLRALRGVATAVRAAPWLAPLRARLAQQAVAASGRYAAAAARACVPASTADVEAIACGAPTSAHVAAAAAPATQPRVAGSSPAAGGDAGALALAAAFTPPGAALGAAFTAGLSPDLLLPAAAAARATGLARATAAAVVEEAGAEVKRLQAKLRAAPGGTGLWVLLATMSLQRAIGTGQCRHHRHALACCRAAEQRLRVVLQQWAHDPDAAAALHVARVRMLVGSSESHLHSRLPGTLDAARAAAHAAVETAAAGGGCGPGAPQAAAAAAAGLARRQVARVLWAEGHAADAEAAYWEAAAAGDACAQLELAKLLGTIGRVAEAAEQLRALRAGAHAPAASEDAADTGGRFEASAGLEEALALAGMADLQGARGAAAAALAVAEGRCSGGRAAQAAAHLVIADVALRQVRADDMLHCSSSCWLVVFVATPAPVQASFQVCP